MNKVMSKILEYRGFKFTIKVEQGLFNGSMYVKISGLNGYYNVAQKVKTDKLEDYLLKQEVELRKFTDSFFKEPKATDEILLGLGFSPDKPKQKEKSATVRVILTALSIIYTPFALLHLMSALVIKIDDWSLSVIDKFIDEA